MKKINEKYVDILQIYTPLSVAKKEIWKRWNNKELRKKVENFLGGKIPEPFKKAPIAVLSRSVITPNLEFFYFLDLAKITSLKPIGLEGIEDRFCTKNYDKVSLGKLSFLNHKNVSDRSDETNRINIIDMTRSDGKKFCDIKTLWGENLVDFHHRMLELYGIKIEIFDDFKWFGHVSGKNNIVDYYEKFFAIFICYGIIFDNFITKRNEKKFTEDVVLKSYKKIEKFFGVKPLIVPIIPIEDDDHWYFRSYIKRK